MWKTASGSDDVIGNLFILEIESVTFGFEKLKSKRKKPHLAFQLTSAPAPLYNNLQR